ncbi:MAG: SBBP repeat-containing protein [Cyanobacteria bacterium J06621_11]
MDNQDNSNISVSLLSPASDLVGGSSTAEFEALFGRAGNDTLYGFDPAASYPEINIDFLFGDLFDNSAEEFEILLGITEGRPLGILETNIPSVGRDRFVLGDERQAYYTAPNPFSLATDNPLGTNEFAVIYDFDPTDDTIQLFGKDKDYDLIEINGLEIEGFDQAISGEAIFYNGGGIPDLVGFIVSTPEQDFSFKENKDAFDFVVDKVKKGKKEFVQISSPGTELSQNTTVDSFGNVYVVGSTSGAIGGINQGRGDVWIAKYNNNGNRLWVRQLGDEDSEDAYEVVTDEQGDVYIAGNTSSNLFGNKQASGTDAWVAKLDGNNGNLVWGEQFNAGVLAGDNVNPAFDNTAFGLDVKGDRVFVSGLAIKNNPNRQIFDFSVQDDSWVGTFDKDSGQRQWFTQLRDPQAPFPLSITPFFDENYDLAVDDAGNSYLVGWTQGLSKEADPSRLLLKYDAYLAKVDPTGNIDWVQQFGTVGEGLEFGWAVDTDSQGNIYTSGWTTGDFSGEAPDANEYDVFVSKFDASGNQLATKLIGTNGDDGQYFGDLMVDNSDNVYLTGYTRSKEIEKGKEKELKEIKRKEDSTDAFVAKLDSNLNEQWIAQLGNKEKLDYATGVTADGRGNVFVTGFTDGSLGEQPGQSLDGWVARLDDEKGKLEKFVGKDGGGDFSVVTGFGNITVTDASNDFVTDDALPSGDNDVSTGLGSVDYSEIVGSLQGAFDPSSEGGFSSALNARLNGTGSGTEDSTDASSNNTLNGSDDKEDMKGTDGGDRMFGFGGDDKLEGKEGSDFLDGGTGDDKLKGGKGNDVMYGQDGEDKVEGGDGNDQLYGGRGDDEVKGGDDNDIIFGIDIEDPLLGRGERDKLKGEDGRDLFVLGTTDGVFYQGNGDSDYALIDDFKADKGDRIQLSGSLGSYTLEGKKGNEIFYQGDLVGIVKDAKDLNLTDSRIFEFV